MVGMTVTDCRYRHPGGRDGFEMTVREGLKKKGRAYLKKYMGWAFRSRHFGVWEGRAFEKEVR